jgi:IS30 family transposase
MADVGRPTKLDDEVRRKIEEAAALDASVEEIAFYAGVHRATLHRWIQEDEELRDRIQELRERPILKARQTITKALDDPNHAFRYLERKRRKEFAPNVDLTSDGQALMVNVISFDANRNNTPQLQGPDGVSA